MEFSWKTFFLSRSRESFRIDGVFRPGKVEVFFSVFRLVWSQLSAQKFQKAVEGDGRAIRKKDNDDDDGDPLFSCPPSLRLSVRRALHFTHFNIIFMCFSDGLTFSFDARRTVKRGRWLLAMVAQVRHGVGCLVCTRSFRITLHPRWFLV